MERRRYRLGLALMLASTLAWSTGGIFSRLIQADVWTTLGWRGLFGAAGIAVLIWAMEGPTGLRRLARMGRLGWAYAGLSFLGMICFVTSLRLTTVAHVAVIYATVPFLAASLGWLVLRERPSGLALRASLAALAGVAIMTGLGGEGTLAGDALALVMTLTMAVMIILPRRYAAVPTLQAACLSGLAAAVFCWPLGAPLSVTLPDLILMALFGLVNMVLGFALFAVGARLLPPVETALIGALEAPLSPLWIWLIFGEAPGPATILGGTIVFAAVVGHITLSSRRSPHP